jgi:ribosomal protein L29
MAITEQNRRDIFNGLETTLGSDVANNIMELLPFTPAAHLVTREDMHANTLALRGDMAELRGELKGDMAELRAELKGDMAMLRGEMAELRGEVKQDIARLETSMNQRFEGFQGQLTLLRHHTNKAVVGGMVINALAILTAGIIS